MRLMLEDGSVFASGSTPYRYEAAIQSETMPRIIVPIEIDDRKYYAYVDTGAFYLLCHPDVAEILGLDSGDALEVSEIKIRGCTVAGEIHRLELGLRAETGQGLRIDATAFLPLDRDWWEWGNCAVLGLCGCLDRMRFAVDPTGDVFYFGPLGSDV